MDPVSALGVASAILAFGECTIKFIVSMKKIYDSASDESLGPQAREAKIKEIQDLATRAAFHKSDLNAQERAVNVTAEECRRIADELGGLMKGIQPGKGKYGKFSILECFYSATKQTIKKRKLEELEGDLRACMKALLQQRIFTDTAATRGMLEKLENEGIPLDQGTMGQLRTMMVRSIAQLEVANRQNIINALDFDSMDRRYHTVKPASADTFEWIFSSTETDLEPNPRNFPFKTWLASEEGIFHISGKPGAGKSTLMKFLYTHAKTTPLLKQWAGREKIVLARIFFWKPGSELQKNSEGMCRSLLSQILGQAPELAPCLFPTFWKPENYHMFNATPRINIDNLQVKPVLQRLIDAKDMIPGYRFCFFIDGLDEFDDAEDSQRDFARHLQRWIQASDGKLKICASSRELPDFQAHVLRPVYRIKLQDLTRLDIVKYVRFKLELERGYNEDYFHSINSDKIDACDALFTKIVEKAEGVFLWVVLTMTLLCDKINTHEARSHKTLLDLIDGCPADLQDMFSRIFHSIPTEYRKEAYFMLMFATECARLEMGLVLYQLIFLRELVADPHNISCPHITNEEIEFRLQNSSARLSAYSRGLLEPRDWRLKQFPHEPIPAYRQSVCFIHRSITEFLSESLAKEPSGYLADFDFVRALVSMLLVSERLVSFTASDALDEEIHIHVLQSVRVLSNIEQPLPDLVFRSLDAIDDYLCAKKLLSPKDEDWQIDDTMPKAAFRHLFDGYVAWCFKKNRLSCERRAGIILNLHATYSRRHPIDRQKFARARTILTLLYDNGFGCEIPFGRYNTDKVINRGKAFSAWEYIVEDMCLLDESGNWQFVQILLELGASPPIFVREDEVTIKITVGERIKFLVSHSDKWDWHLPWIPEKLKSKQGVATLRDFLDVKEYVKRPPWNIVELKAVLDKVYAGFDRGTATESTEQESFKLLDGTTPTLEVIDTSRTSVGDDIMLAKGETATEIKQEETDSKRLENGNDDDNWYSFMTHILQALRSPWFPWALLGMLHVLLPYFFRG